MNRFRDLLLLDDLEREDRIERTDSESLEALATSVEPLYAEINTVLDRLEAEPHPLPEPLDQLEYDLHALGQAAIEAQQALDARRGD